MMDGWVKAVWERAFLHNHIGLPKANSPMGWRKRPDRHIPGKGKKQEGTIRSDSKQMYLNVPLLHCHSRGKALGQIFLFPSAGQGTSFSVMAFCTRRTYPSRFETMGVFLARVSQSLPQTSITFRQEGDIRPQIMALASQ
jgi:hypothetical protein